MAADAKGAAAGGKGEHLRVEASNGGATWRAGVCQDFDRRIPQLARLVSCLSVKRISGQGQGVRAARPERFDCAATRIRIALMHSVGNQVLKNKPGEPVRAAAAGEAVPATDREQVVAGLIALRVRAGASLVEQRLGQLMRLGPLTPAQAAPDAPLPARKPVACWTSRSSSACMPEQRARHMATMRAGSSIATTGWRFGQPIHDAGCAMEAAVGLAFACRRLMPEHAQLSIRKPPQGPSCRRTASQRVRSPERPLPACASWQHRPTAVTHPAALTWPLGHLAPGLEPGLARDGWSSNRMCPCSLRPCPRSLGAAPV